MARRYIKSNEDDEDEDDTPCDDDEGTVQGVDVSPLERCDGGDLNNALLNLIGLSTQVLALLREVSDEEFAYNAQRLQFFFDLVNLYPTSSMNKKPPARKIGFVVAEPTTKSKKGNKTKTKR